MLIGVTGNIGAGKSLVSKMFEELGARVIDADKEVHHLYTPTSPVTEKLIQVFGTEIRAEDGSIDREALGDLVFHDPEKLRHLNAIVHPEVRNAILAKVGGSHQNEIVVIEATLLVEGGWTSIVDSLILVVAEKNEREKRLLRRGMNPERIVQVMNVQVPALQKVGAANYIIDNNSSEEKTKVQVKAVWDELHRDKE